MKKSFFVLVFAGCLLFQGIVFAHPPSKIDITFDKKTSTLKAVIYHSTSNPARHYINKVDIGINGKEVMSDNITNDADKMKQIVTYKMSQIKTGDVVSVEGYCSISGNRTASINIE
ncbi:MAG: hypothetical protein PHC58_05495 [Candidatus Omnitrophica bacterium]|nr:hypothetical protein [Candidatus Omnitrophota bacterium]